MKKSLGRSNVWSGIPQQEYQIQSTLDLCAINGGRGVEGLFFAFNSASGRHRQWIRLSRTAMSYQIEHQNSNQRGFERWPFGFFFSVHLGIQQVQAFTKTKQERMNKINIILVVGLGHCLCLSEACDWLVKHFLGHIEGIQRHRCHFNRLRWINPKQW